MRFLTAAIFLLSLSQPGAAQLVGNRAPAGCIDVAGPHARVTATGRLTAGMFTDSEGTERAFILELRRPACIDDGDEFADSSNFTQIHVTWVNGKVLRKLQRAVGRQVTLSGSGFAAHTRHHHRPLVVLADQVSVR